MTEKHAIRRCYHDGITLVRLPPVDPREPDDHDFRLAFKRAQMRKWLREVVASRRNVIRFGTAAKS